jgi:ABC-type phosphate/phosphonate transport system permease subunit
MTFKRIVSAVLLSVMLVCTIPVIDQAARNAMASEKEETALSLKIDTKKLSGINLVIARMYNEDRVLYAAMVTIVMAVLGTVLAFLTDLVLKALGLEVSRISHRE